MADATVARMIRDVLEKAFPSGQVDDRLVDRFEHALRASKRPEFRAFRTRGDIQEERPKFTEGPAITYTMSAFHRRVTPFESSFTGDLQVVRVSLGDQASDTFETSIGKVEQDDHLLFSAEDVRSQYGYLLPYEIERVDLVTPARYDFFRFAPLALFLGYRHANDPEPSFFILEAGTATGQAKQLYFAPTLDTTIVQRSGYEPTPFSKAEDFYRGQLIMDGNDPATLTIASSRERTSDPYITIEAEFTREVPSEVTFPGVETAVAALRVETIARGMQWDLNLFEELMAEVGERLLEWDQKPPE